MGIKAVKVVPVAEDEQLACFARRFLEKFGYTSWDWRVEKPKAGKGSGEQFVREQMPGELEAMRDYQSEALIILTDTDTMTVKKRIQTLRKECSAKGVDWRKQGEAVLLITPKRNIETWLAYLRGETVDEEREQPYPKYDAESDCRDQVNELHKMCDKGKLREPAPASLVAACEEWKLMP
jgi:hypothetical protein